MRLELANRRACNRGGKWLIMVGIILALVAAGAPVTAQPASNCKTLSEIRLRRIVVSDEAKAHNVEAQLRSGAKFETLAAKFSTDSKSRNKGGDLGFVSSDQLQPDVAQAVSTLDIGAVTKPIHTTYGYEIVQLEERRIGTSCGSNFSKPASPRPCGRSTSSRNSAPAPRALRT